MSIEEYQIARENQPVTISGLEAVDEIIESKLEEITANTDKILKKVEINSRISYNEEVTQTTGNRVAGSRWQLCGLSSELVAYQINNDLELRQIGVYSKPIQNMELHLLVRSQFQSNLTEEQKKEAFGHAITLIFRPDKIELVDLTICQYFDPETQLISEGSKSIPITYNKIPIIRELITKGKFCVSDPNSLFKYLMITTHNRDSHFLQTLMKYCQTTDLTQVPILGVKSMTGENSLQKLLYEKLYA